ncbi:MAG TPA: MaoC/PaaZ C-terminal domain-containing protein [Pseudolabrys sp.]|nr:MaoC/PaaZ C-terminal domain-containing protein [Pseudolabrys sp.]
MTKNMHYEEFEIGQVFTTKGRTVTESDIVTFAGLSGDYTAIHMDEEFAKATPFGGRIAHGFLGVALMSGLLGQLGLTEETAMALLDFSCRFAGAIRIGDTIKVRQIVKEKRTTSKPGRGIVTFDLEVFNQRDEVVIAGSEKIMIRSRA